jgi:K+:H+ antiporter subunit KhtT
MAEVNETRLPGVGVRYDFTTADGSRVGVLVHRTGRRELLVYGREDPDACQAVLRLDAADTHTLVDLLGGSQVSEELAAMQQLEGLTIDWLRIPATSPWVGRSLRDAAVRSITGVSVVAVVRGDTTIPAPEPDFVLDADDIAVVVGTPAGIDQLVSLLRGG